MHRVGIEEELFVVDHDGRLVPEAKAVLRAHRGLASDEELEHELFLQQVELQTSAHDDPAALRADLVRQRSAAVEAARMVGRDLVAVPVDVLGGAEPVTTPNSRYERMLARYGGIGRNGLTCGMHVHVEVPDDRAVSVVDGLRPWTPLLSALSANAPFHEGRDTGHASWRGHLWDAWPTSGPVEPFGDEQTYRSVVAETIASGAAVDEHMMYLDARIAEDLPTVEIRVADVCTDVYDALLVAEIIRALVGTLLTTHERPGPWRVEHLRAARWRARHDGLGGHLVDPLSRRLVPAEDALASLLDTIGPALDEAGTAEEVTDGVRRLLDRGTGADRQREVAGDDLDLAAVMADLVRRTDPHHA